MSRFYTNITITGNTVLVREIVDGIPNMRKDAWQPTLYVTGPGKLANENFTSMYGDPVHSVQPGSISDCKEFMERYDGVQGFQIFGQLNFSLQYMNEYKSTAWSYDKISAWSIDIETAIPVDENGKTYFPKPETAPAEILLITLVNMQSGVAFTWGSKPYSGKDTHYTHCADEKQLLKLFLQFWDQKRIDIITGWNIAQFDIPYLHNRIVDILGEDAVKMLSPWKRVSCKTRMFMGNLEHQTYITGVSILDYIDLYKKNVDQKQESYSLNHIAMAELGHTKLHFDGSFTDFYTNNWEMFVEYNIVDAQLVRQIEDKIKLIILTLTMAYNANINYEDVSSPVKLWDAIIANYCLDKGIIVPQQSREKDEPLDGAYVKTPIPGWYHNVVTLDATSLYPSCIMTNNISPETWQGNCGLGIDDFLAGAKIDVDQKFIVTPTGAVYSKDKRGILPELVEYYMAKRKTAKSEMLRLQQEYENTKDKTLNPKIAALDVEQNAIKRAMNSLYGATANKHFRFYKHDHASSITLTGQFVLRTIEAEIDDLLNKEFGTTGAKYLVYIDTDSLIFTLDAPFKKYNVDPDKAIKTLEKLAKDKITKIVNGLCQRCCDTMRSYENKLSFKLEGAVDKAIWVAKKRYIMRVHSSEGVTYSKPKFKVKGLEMVRSSTPQFVRDKLKVALDVVFDTDEQNTQKFIQDVKTEFYKLPYQQVAFPRGANNLKEYSDKNNIYKKGVGEGSTPIQVRGALLYNHYLKAYGLDGEIPSIGEGDKIKFMYLKKPNKLRENVIAFPTEGDIPPQFGILDKVDYDLQFEKTFLAGMNIILDAINWKSVETSSLEDFFG